jgi:hypothetical protein
MALDHLSLVMDVYYKIIKAALHESAHVVFENRCAGNLNHRLGPIGGKGPQTRPFSRGKNHRFQCGYELWARPKRAPLQGASNAMNEKEMREHD